jgi:hypothetical protein
MPLPDADKKSPRVYTNLQNIDLDSVTFANVQSTGNPIAVEEMNEDEMRRLVLVNLARLVCAGEWNGLLTAGGGAETLGELTDVLMDATDFTDGLLIQTNSGGSAPTTGTLNNSEESIGIGKDCLKAITSADYCTFVGGRAGEAITTGNYNSGFGRMALYQVSTQSGNTGCGYFAGAGIQNGANNTAVGYATLGTNNDGARNTAIGGNALGAVTTGNDNIALGYNAGDSVSSGDNNVVIGGVAVASATADDQLVISSGDGGMFWIKGDSAGSCYQGDNASSWSTTSDRRIKREITDATQGLDAINGIRLRNFRYRRDNPYGLDPDQPRVGVIAQELEEVFPEAVKENLEGHKTVSTDSINWALLKAVQELSAKVEALEAVA